MPETTKRTMTLNLNDDEMRVLETLAERKDLTKTAVIRQALRLYQMVSVRREQGDKLVLENEQTKEKAELMLL
jgi:predicted transcriptional regulator